MIALDLLVSIFSPNRLQAFNLAIFVQAEATMCHARWPRGDWLAPWGERLWWRSRHRASWWGGNRHGSLVSLINEELSDESNLFVITGNHVVEKDMA
jgi:hypothetical protein